MLPDLSGLSLKFFVDEELEEEETPQARARRGRARRGEDRSKGAWKLAVLWPPLQLY